MKGISKITQLLAQLKPLYKKHDKSLLFHGWHHIVFVRKKALKFASLIDADKLIVEAAALTHDLNHIIKSGSNPEIGMTLRKEFLSKAGFANEEINKIEHVIMEADIRIRNEKITPEGMALSDADTLFKCLPIMPIFFTSKYIAENKADIYKLARKIISEQEPLIKKGIYFYTDYAKKKYSDWAKCNLQLWKNVIDALEDDEIKEVMKSI
ncbi:MAG: HD family phosphohydrolase [Patescibacteria group bacterium]|nr:HD family phosphohydrolase [Patescibacteria group bacterium]